jgi:hypothetical protein
VSDFTSILTQPSVRFAVGDFGTVIAMASAKIPVAALRQSLPPSLPVRHGLLRASGDTLEGLRPSDAFDIVVDPRGDVSALLLHDPAGRNARRAPLDEALRAARIALLGRSSIQDVVSAVAAEAARSGHAEIALSVVRLCQTDSRVEVLNAGMPPIACAAQDRVSVHSALSLPVGRDDERRHAYEVVPLIWGSTWLLGSPGLTRGSLLAESVQELCARLELGTRGLELAAKTPESLRQMLLTRHPDASRLSRDDASLLLIGADPNARLESRTEWR